MRILIFVLALTSLTLSVVSLPLSVSEDAKVVGSYRLAHDGKDESHDDKKKTKTWIRRKRTVIV
ncbi:hypothetical protein [Primorskyibacter sp. 2E233]|uniref:hypothetical protein n=1 Tax=Primorskyibacter sp. 2E233 TaxID=3413431 RepID=UPI003BF26E12